MNDGGGSRGRTRENRIDWARETPPTRCAHAHINTRHTATGGAKTFVTGRASGGPLPHTRPATGPLNADKIKQFTRRTLGAILRERPSDVQHRYSAHHVSYDFTIIITNLIARHWKYNLIRYFASCFVIIAIILLHSSA